MSQKRISASSWGNVKHEAIPTPVVRQVVSRSGTFTQDRIQIDLYNWLRGVQPLQGVKIGPLASVDECARLKGLMPKVLKKLEWYTEGRRRGAYASTIEENGDGEFYLNVVRLGEREEVVDFLFDETIQ